MARNDNRNHRAESVDRAHWRAGADSWHALLATAVVLMGVVPALLIGALVLIEAVLSNARPAQPEIAHRAPAQPGLPSWQPSVPPRMQFSTTCTLFELAPCRRD